MSETLDRATFGDLLDRALTQPGIISAAYNAFHGYSIGNQLLAMFQCEARGIAPGPIATFMSWKHKGRYVRKGEKALVLCMPITGKRKADEPADDDVVFTRFVYRPNWFVLAQTDGEALATEPIIADWDSDRALAALAITVIPFDKTDGNCQGYAQDRSIAINPVAALPHKTRFHELAHVMLGHTAEAGQLADGESTPRSLREVEAEAVAYVCLQALGLPGSDESRGYIQHWNAARDAQPIPERSAQRIFKAADTILKAGRPADTTD